MIPAYRNIRFGLVRELLEKYPDSPTLTLARMLYRDNPAFFDSVESARNIIRYHRGAKGEKARNRLKSKKYVKIPTT